MPVLAVATALSGCGLHVETDHRTATSSVEPLADVGPEPGRLQEVWQTELDADSQGYHLIGGHVVVVVEDGLRAYDARTGEPAWHYIEAGRSLGALAESDGAVVVRTYRELNEDTGTVDDAHLVGLDAVTGDELWEVADDVRLVSTAPASISLGVGGYGTSSSSERGDAADGVVVVEPGDSSIRAGIDARTGEELWRVEGSEVADSCDPVVADDAAEAAAAGDPVVVLRFTCRDREVAVAVGARTGELRWRRALATGGTLTRTAENVVLIEAGAEQPPVLVGPDGTDVFVGEPGSSCLCAVATAGDRLVLSYDAADGSDVVGIDPASGVATPIPVEGTYLNHGSAEVAGSRIFQPGGSGALLPMRLAVFDLDTMAERSVPLPAGIDADTEWFMIGAGGGMLFTVRREPAEDGDPTGRQVLAAYDVATTAEPVELGGVPVEDWPDPCALVAGMPGEDDFHRVQRGQPLEIGEVAVEAACHSWFGAAEEASANDVRVEVLWVAATEAEATARFGLSDLVVGSAAASRDLVVPGADAARENNGSVLMQVGAVIVRVGVGSTSQDRDEILAIVAANLRNT